MAEQLDPSQRAAEPLKPVKTAEFIRQMREAGTQVEIVPEETARAIKENQEHAQQEIAMIFELNDSVAFRWFMEKFVLPDYDLAFRQLRGLGEPSKPEELPAIQIRYETLRKIRAGMLTREIAHRERLDSTDAQIPRLRERLNLL